MDALTLVAKLFGYWIGLTVAATLAFSVAHFTPSPAVLALVSVAILAAGPVLTLRGERAREQRAAVGQRNADRRKAASA